VTVVTVALIVVTIATGGVDGGGGCGVNPLPYRL
jgi:hypothetical protein